MDDESIQDRVDFLDDRRVRDILVRVIEALADGEGTMTISDILAENYLLTNKECLRVFLASKGA